MIEDTLQPLVGEDALKKEARLRRKADDDNNSFIVYAFLSPVFKNLEEMTGESQKHSLKMTECVSQERKAWLYFCGLGLGHQALPLKKRSDQEADSGKAGDSSTNRLFSCIPFRLLGLMQIDA